MINNRPQVHDYIRAAVRRRFPCSRARDGHRPGLRGGNFGLAATRSAERTPRSPGRMPRQHPEDCHSRRRHRRDLVDQCSAYACPMHACARPPRRAPSTRQSPRNRSSPATSRRAHPAYACVRRIDKASRKSPEKPGPSTPPRTRTRWSQRCAYAKEREEPEELVAGVMREPTTVQL